MPPSVWPYQTYPGYCIAFTVVLSAGVAQLLLQAQQQLPESMLNEMWIDDVLYTGIFRRDAGILIRDHQKYFINAAHGIHQCNECVAVHVNSRVHLITLLWQTYVNHTHT